MKRIDTTQEGFRTSVLGKHLETLPREGFYPDNVQEVRKYGLHRFYHDAHVILYRTENGIAMDLIASKQHLILGTSNYGNPISDNVWMTIAESLLQLLGSGFANDYFVASTALEEHASEYIKYFESQFSKLIIAD